MLVLLHDVICRTRWSGEMLAMQNAGLGTGDLGSHPQSRMLLGLGNKTLWLRLGKHCGFGYVTVTFSLVNHNHDISLNLTKCCMVINNISSLLYSIQ